MWATAPTAARARRRWPARRRPDPQPGDLLPGEPLLRQLLRLRAGGAAPRLRPAARLLPTRRLRRPAPGVPPDRAAERRPRALVGRGARPVRRRADGRLLQELGQRRARLLHRGRAAVLLLAVRRSRCGAVRELLLLGPRPDLAQPLLPDVRHLGRHHGQRLLLLRHPRLGRVADHPRPPRGGRGHVEDLQPRRPGRCPRRRRRQRGVALEPLGGRPADARHLRRVPARLRGRHAAGRVVAHPELHAAPRRARAQRRLGRDAPPAAGHRRAADVTALAALGVPAQLRRARRVLRPRRAAAGRRVRARRPRAAVGDLADAAAPGRRRDAPARRARLDAQADRAPASPAHARLAQPRVRPRDADGSSPRRVRRARPSARRAEGDQRPDGAVRPRAPRPGSGRLRLRRNGVSKTDAKARANTIVSGTTRASETTKAGTPWRTRPATIFS